MLTPFGKTLRKLRLERDMSMLDMANNIGLSSAYVSAVETGRKSLHEGYVKKVIEVMNLTPSEENELKEAAMLTNKKNPILNIESKENQQLVAAFARRINNLPQDVIDKIKDMLDDHSTTN